MGWTSKSLTASSKGGSLIQRNPACIACTFVIQNQEIDSSSTLDTLSRKSRIPLLLFLPGHLVKAHRPLYEHYPCWPSQLGAGLQWHLRLHPGDDRPRLPGRPHRPAAQRRGLPLLRRPAEEGRTAGQEPACPPTLPQIVLQIMRLVEDPRTTSRIWKGDHQRPIDGVELLEVVKSPVFAGRRRSAWTCGRSSCAWGCGRWAPSPCRSS